MRVLQLCKTCASTYHWDVEGRLTGTDLANLGFPPQPGRSQVLEEVKKARKEGRLRTKDEALDYAKRHLGFQKRSSDVRYRTIYIPAENWKASDPPDWRIQPGYEGEESWWKHEVSAGHMVLYGMAIDRPLAGSIMVGWLCSTLNEAVILASRSPWVAARVTKIMSTSPVEPDCGF